jgi:hypothetical protein
MVFLENGTTVIYVIRRNGEKLEVFIDTNDIQLINSATNSIWVNNQKQVGMNRHDLVGRFLLNINDGQVKFLNENPLDLRRFNMVKSYNTFIEKENYVEMYTRKEEKILIDKEDKELLSNHTWSIDNNGRVIAKINKKYTQIGRFLLNPPSDKEVDHINRDPLDNRRCNLRICSHMDNSKNRDDERTKKFRGVSKLRENAYVMRIKYDGNYRIDRTFLTEIAAANAYNYYAKKYHGEFAVLNDCEILENWIDYIKIKKPEMRERVHELL